MTAHERVMNLDEVPTQPVVLGGNSYVIEQHRWALVTKVLSIKAEMEASAGKMDEGEDEDSYRLRVYGEQWDRVITACAHMLGFEDTPEQHETWEEVIEHLTRRLTIPGAMKIWDRWYEINQIDDFFVRGGRILMEPVYVATYKGVREKIIEEAAQEHLPEPAPQS